MTLHAPDWYAARHAAFSCGLPVDVQTVPLAQADGRVLALDARSRTDLPGFDTSAMDGWAVAGPGPWRAIGSVLAGRAPGLDLAPGQCCLIATGAAVPAGAEAVVRREDGEIRDGILFARTPAPGQDVRPRGEECRAGDVLVGAGTLVNPAHVGLLSAAGLDEVLVRRRLRAALVLFGDELVDHGVAGIGQVRDSLGPQLPGWLGRLGVDVARVVRAEDTLAAHVAAIAEARSGVDVVITTGGTAAGPVDHLHPAVAAVGGTFVVDAVSVRPGHPMALAALPEVHSAAAWLLALPGNPQSAVVALLTLGAPLLDAMYGRPVGRLDTVTLDSDIAAPAREHRLVACSVRSGTATPVVHLGSAMLRGLSLADGFAVVPPGGAAARQEAPYLPLPS